MTRVVRLEAKVKTWQVQEAKAKFSEVIKKAAKEGPQTITVHGESTAVVLSKTEYDRLKRPQKNLVEFMRRSPLFGVELKLTRKQSPTRGTDIR
jgi:antitoxin Phd